MKANSLILVAAMCAATLAACSRNQPPADSIPTPASGKPPATAAGAEPAAPMEVVNPLADFSVEPGTVYSCDGRDRTVSTVKWQVKDPSVVTVKVEVDSDTDPARKTFTSGGNVGEAKTGNWVGAGVTFHLVDAAGGKELAAYSVKSLPCN